MLFLRVIIIALLFVSAKPHPFYMSVTDLKYNGKSKSMEISCKLFTNDLESTLKKQTGKAIDLLHPKDKNETEKIIFDYISNHLLIRINSKSRSLKFLGYEKEEDAIVVYLEIEKCESLKEVTIHTSLLYEYIKEEINIVRLQINDTSKSSKVSNPDTEIKFSL